MDKIDDRDKKADRSSDPGLPHLRPESAEIYRRMTENKRPLSSSMTLFYPGGDESDGDDESFLPPSQRRAVLRSGVQNQSGGEVRRFKLSSVRREVPKDEPVHRSFSFPDMGGAEKPRSRQKDRFSEGEAVQDRMIRVRGTASSELSAAGSGKNTGQPVNLSYNEDRTQSDSILRNDSPKIMMEVSQLHKGYVKGKNTIPVLDGVDVQVREGEFLAVVGQSGSGKSTLLHLMGTLDVPDSGTVHFDGQRIDNLPSRRRDYLRNHYIGMIFQFYHLIPEMTMIENVLAPLMVRHSLPGYLRHRKSYIDQAKELLDLVGLSQRMKHRPNELSGGEMQRTSIARALITHPRVLLADEPTGNLDSKTTLEIIKLLRSLNREKNLTIIMVTHDMEQARDADRVVRLVDGRVVDNFRTGSP